MAIAFFEWKCYAFFSKKRFFYQPPEVGMSVPLAGRDLAFGGNAHKKFFLADNPEVCAVHFEEMDKRLHEGVS